MKKPIEKRLNIALYAREWEILQRYMEEHDVDQTQAIRNLLRDYGRRQEASTNNPPYSPSLIGDDFGRVTTPTLRPGNIACSGCGKVSVAELNADGIWAYPFSLFRYVDGRILCVDCNEKETSDQ